MVVSGGTARGQFPSVAGAGEGARTGGDGALHEAMMNNSAMRISSRALPFGSGASALIAASLDRLPHAEPWRRQLSFGPFPSG